MGQKNTKGSVAIINAAGRIRLRWRYQSNRYTLSLFQFNESNLLRANRIALQIENDIIIEQFDTTLNRYRPVAQKKSVDKIQKAKSLVEYFEHWVTAYRNMDCEKDIDYNSTRNMMLRWGNFNVTTALRHLNKETFGPHTYNRRLALLNAFF